MANNKLPKFVSPPPPPPPQETTVYHTPILDANTVFSCQKTGDLFASTDVFVTLKENPAAKIEGIQDVFCVHYERKKTADKIVIKENSSLASDIWNLPNIVVGKP